MSDPNFDAPIATSVGTAKAMLESAVGHYADSIKGSMYKSADFWDGYIHAVRHILRAGGHVE